MEALVITKELTMWLNLKKEKVINLLLLRSTMMITGNLIKISSLSFTTQTVMNNLLDRIQELELQLSMMINQDIFISRKPRLLQPLHQRDLLT